MQIWTISDIHGYKDAFQEILIKIGFLDQEGNTINLPKDKKLILLGDYIDRGNQPFEVIMLIKTLKEAYGDNVVALMGNHDSWIIRYLRGNNIQLNEERQQTLDDIKGKELDTGFKEVLDGLEYCHREEYGGQVYTFAHAMYIHEPKKPRDKNLMLYGLVFNGEKDEKGFPRRKEWYKTYDGRHGKVIFGHYSLDSEVTEFENAVCIDTGVFKTGTLAAHEVISGETVYVKGYTPVRKE